MTSASIFKDTLKNDTRVFVIFETLRFKFLYELWTSFRIANYLISSTQSFTAGTSKVFPLEENLPPLPSTQHFFSH